MSDKSLKKVASKGHDAHESTGSAARHATQPRGNAAAQEMLKARGGGDTPYADTYGKGTGKGAAFQVDAGQLTFDAEGTEGGRFHSRKAHVPPGPSGVTIGRGYDLGQHTRAQISADLAAVGLSASDAAAYAKAAGLKDGDARAWLARNKSALTEISAEQQEALFTTTYGEMSKDVQRISRKEDVRKLYGAADIEGMNPAIKDALVDLRYRGDYTGGAREKIQGAAAENDLLAVTDSLSDRKQWRNVPEDRFKRRAAYLQEEVVQVEMDAYGSGFGPREHGVDWPSLAELKKRGAGKDTPPTQQETTTKAPAPSTKSAPPEESSPPAARTTRAPTDGGSLSGSDVYVLQVKLASLGLPCGDDGTFSAAVRGALATFQQAHGLAASGEADGATLTAIEAARAAVKPSAGETMTEAPAKPTGPPPVIAPPRPAASLPPGKEVGAADEWSDSTLVDYAEYLRLELKSFAKLDRQSAASKATVTLKQVERFVAALRKTGLLDTYDVARQPLSDQATGSWVPPELVPTTRALAEVAEGNGSEDWNSRLGAQQYRTQSDNLAAPEATCNVTSMSMVLERLGYSRADVVAAVDRELKGRWGDAVLRYLDKQQGAGKAYQRLRGHDTTGKERRQVAGTFRTDAQMEDLVDFLLSMLGVDRTAITPSAAKLLGRIETNAGERPSVETIRKGGKNTWDVVRARVHATLEEGGSAMLSVFHKGAGQSGTHLVVAQQVTSTGMIIDDPYGSIRADYDRGKKGDAYAEPGKTRKTSNLRNVPAMVDHDKDGAEDDWKVGAAGDLAANESRGATNEQSDALLSKAWNYVALYHRGGSLPGG